MLQLELSSVHATYKFKLQKSSLRSFRLGGDKNIGAAYKPLDERAESLEDALQGELQQCRTEVKFWKAKFNAEVERVKDLKKLGTRNGRADMFDKYQAAVNEAKRLEKQVCRVGVLGRAPV